MGMRLFINLNPSIFLLPFGFNSGKLLLQFLQAAMSNDKCKNSAAPHGQV